jgi:hypothetical protein
VRDFGCMAEVVGVGGGFGCMAEVVGVGGEFGCAGAPASALASEGCRLCIVAPRALLTLC